MEQKDAIEVLKKLMEKHPLSDEEKEAVMTAIGMLGWAALGKKVIRAKKEKRERSADW